MGSETKTKITLGTDTQLYDVSFFVLFWLTNYSEYSIVAYLHKCCKLLIYTRLEETTHI